MRFHLPVNIAAIFFFFGLTASIAGCGGSQGKSAAGQVTDKSAQAVISIDWPVASTPTKFIHDSADTLRVLVRSGGTIISTATAKKPTGTVTFPALPLYDIEFEVQAYDSSRQGNDPNDPFVMSRAKVATKLKPGIINSIAFVLESVTDHVDVSPNPVTSKVTDTIQLYAQSIGKDNHGQDATIVSGLNFTWSSSDEGVALVDKTSGIVTAVGQGTATISAQEAGNDSTGKTGSATIAVQQPIPQGNIDSPLNFQLIHDNQFGIAGWVNEPGLGASGIGVVHLLVDGQDLGSVQYPVHRDDGNPGFSLLWNTSAISSGDHDLLLRAVDSAGRTFDIQHRDVGIAHGNLIREQGQGTVYYVNNGTRRAFTTLDCFIDWGYSAPDQVPQYPHSTVYDNTTWSPPIPHIVTVDGGTLYLVQDGILRHISSWDVFTGMGFTKDDIRLISSDRFGSYPNYGIELNTVEPQLIVVNGPTFTPSGGFQAGQPIHVEFTVRNIATTSAPLDGITLSVRRDSDNFNCDFPFSAVGSIASGAEYTYRGDASFARSEGYHFNCSYRIFNDRWYQAVPSGMYTVPADSFSVSP